MSQFLFKTLGSVHEFFKRRGWLTWPVKWILDKWAPAQMEDDTPWEEEAEVAMLEQEALRARKILYWAAGVILVLIIWAAFTKVDEVTRGEGRVIPSRQVQVIQSLDGGIVSELLVREGEAVNVGTPLVKIDETRAISSLRENRVQYLSLLAKQARLRALLEDKPFTLPPEVLKESPALYAQEQALYQASRAELASQVEIAREQLNQRQRELVETQAKLSQAERSYELTSRELAVTKPLQSSGAVSEVDLLRLERDTARFLGDRDQAKAQLSRVQSAIVEARRKVDEAQQNFRNKSGAELSDTTAKLNSLVESSVALNDKVVQSTLKSPVKGTVSRVFVNTVGGVIQPGKDVMEIVPTDDALILETKIQPKDIGFISFMQPAQVKLTAYDYTIYGALSGKVESISADSVVDDKGNAYYIVRVRTDQAGLGKGLPIIPGMVAQVDIMTGRKSVLSYLLKPVLKAKAYAFTER